MYLGRTRAVKRLVGFIGICQWLSPVPMRLGFHISDRPGGTGIAGKVFCEALRNQKLVFGEVQIYIGLEA